MYYALYLIILQSLLFTETKIRFPAANWRTSKRGNDLECRVAAMPGASKRMAADVLLERAPSAPLENIHESSQIAVVCQTKTALEFHEMSCRGGIKIFKALARLASNSKFLLAKSEKNSPKSCLC
jgi:hypothetical protein